MKRVSRVSTGADGEQYEITIRSSKKKMEIGGSYNFNRFHEDLVDAAHDALAQKWRRSGIKVR